MADLELYYLIWFIRGRWIKGPEFLSKFKFIEAWENRVKAIGYGTMSELTAKQALETAKHANIQTHKEIHESYGQDLKPGTEVSVVADVDGGETATTGFLHYLNNEKVAVLRHTDQLGELCIHFPRVGYRVDRI